MFVQQALFTTTPVLQEDTTPAGRWYITPEGQRYPSVTTVLGATSTKGDSLKAWRQRVGEETAEKITKQAGYEGTQLHRTLEKIILNQWTPLEQHQVFPNIKHLLNQIVPVLRTHVTAVHGSEIPLYSNTLKIAGRTDCLCSWNGTYTILDFKRSNKHKTEDMIEDYFLQTTAYALMIEHLMGIVIPTITIVMGVVEGTQPLVWHFPKDKYICQVYTRVEQYYGLDKTLD